MVIRSTTSGRAPATTSGTLVLTCARARVPNAAASAAGGSSAWSAVSFFLFMPLILIRAAPAFDGLAQRGDFLRQTIDRLLTRDRGIVARRIAVDEERRERGCEIAKDREGVQRQQL